MSVYSQKSCAWCHHLNPFGTRNCPCCGHRADSPRQACDCGQAGCLTPYAPQLKDGERVIFQSPTPELDGRRGTVLRGFSGGYYEIQWDGGEVWFSVWESKLAREADEPNYPLPEKA